VSCEISSEKNEHIKVYACPMCRFTFKLSQRQVTAVACPGCNYLVSINDGVNTLKSAREMIAGFDEKRTIQWERGNAEEEVKVSNFSLVGILVLCMAAILLISWTVLTSEKKVAEEVDPSQILGSSKSNESMNQNEKALFLAKEVGKDFLAATTIDEVWQSIDQTEASKDGLEEYYKLRPLKAFPNPEVRTATFDPKSKTARLTMNSEANVFGIKVNIKNDEAKVDWAAFTGYFSDNIEELQQGKASVVLRAKCSKDFNYNFTVTEKEWICVRLQNNKTDTEILAYVKRSEVQTFSTIENILNSDLQIATLRLELLPFGDNSIKYKIIEVLEEEW
jgi:uncharacterized protein YbaR (Trm112 family)